MRYLVADLHLDHDDVLEYADRPFRSVGAMNDALVARWNGVVDPDDEVVVCGDLLAGERTAAMRWVRRLDGELRVVVGDHDAAVRALRDLRTVAAYRFAAGGYRFHCVHDPGDTPDDWDGWVVHGHHHARRLDEYPFVDPDARRVNVSVEVIGYEPLPVSDLVAYLDSGVRFRCRPDDP